MSGLRFKVGEMAIYAVPCCEECMPVVGDIFKIDECGPTNDGDGVPVDYMISNEEREGPCFDWQLRKIDPPAEPASLTRHEECEVAA
jgi:hypothetical protein